MIGMLDSIRWESSSTGKQSHLPTHCNCLSVKAHSADQPVKTFSEGLGALAVAFLPYPLLSHDGICLLYLVKYNEAGAL